MSDRFDEAAQRLAEYIRSLPDFVYREVGDPYDHIGCTNRGMLDHSVWYYVGEKKPARNANERMSNGPCHRRVLEK